MQISIFGLFGKFNCRVSLDKQLNIIVGENGIGKSTILKICEYVINGDYISLTQYYFEKIVFNIDGKNTYTINYNDIFPDIDEIKRKITEIAVTDMGRKYNLELVDRMNNLNLLKEYIVYVFFDILISRELKFAMSRHSNEYKEQKKFMKKVLQAIAEDGSGDKKTFNSRNNIGVKLSNQTTACFLDLVEKYNMDSQIVRNGIIISKKQNEEFDKDYIYYATNEDEINDEVYPRTISDRLWDEKEKATYYIGEEDSSKYEEDLTDEDEYLDSYDIERKELDEQIASRTHSDDWNEDLWERYTQWAEYTSDISSYNYRPEYYTSEFKQLVNKYREYSYSFIFEKIRRCNKEYIKEFIKHLKSSKIAKINMLIANEYYEQAFIDEILEDINGVLANNEREDYDLEEKTWYYLANPQNMEDLRDYLLPLMPKGSPYEFFLIYYKELIDIPDNYWIREKIYYIAMKVMDKLKNYTNPKISNLQNIYNRYLKSKEIIIKPSGIRLYDKVYDKYSKTLKVDYTKELDLNALSAGEKKIIILFIVATFIKDAIVIVDEPEISLSIIWQETLIKDVLSVFTNSRLIIATQSTHIVSDEGIQQDILYLPQEEI